MIKSRFSDGTIADRISETNGVFTFSRHHNDHNYMRISCSDSTGYRHLYSKTQYIYSKTQYNAMKSFSKISKYEK